MKTLLTFALMTLSLQVHAVEIGPIDGKINNYSSIKTSLFRVSVMLICRSYSFIGPRPSCGNNSYVAEVQEDGTYHIPKVEVDGGYENRLQVDVGIPYENRADLVVYSRGWTFFDRNIRKVSGRLNQFTVFEAVPQQVIYQGVNHEEFLAGAGRDVTNNFELAFKDDGKLGNTSSSYWYRLTGDNGVSETPGSIRGSLFIVAGSLPADALVTIKGKLNVIDSTTRAPVSVETTLPFSSVFPDQARTFKVNPADVPVFDRIAEGEYERTELQISTYINQKYENSWFDGRLSLACENGQAKGVYSVKSRGGADIQFSGDLEVSGTCQGEQAELKVKMPYLKDGTEATLTFGVTRMVRGRWMVISPSDRWDWQVRGGQYTMKIPVRLEDGTAVGNIRVP